MKERNPRGIFSVPAGRRNPGTEPEGAAGERGRAAAF